MAANEHHTPTASRALAAFLTAEQEQFGLARQQASSQLFQHLEQAWLEPLDTGADRRPLDQVEAAELFPFFDDFLNSTLSQHLSWPQILEAEETLNRCYNWLADHDYLPPDVTAAYGDQVVEARKPETSSQRQPRSSDVKFHAATGPAIASLDEHSQEYVSIRKVKPGKVWLTMGNRDLGPVRVPRSFSGQCQAGWELLAEVGRKGDKWYLYDVLSIER